MRKITLEFDYWDYLEATDRLNTDFSRKRWLHLVAVINKESWLDIMNGEIRETVQLADREMK